MKDVYTFDPAAATAAHEGTILASAVLPPDFPAPFGHAWGYLAGPGEMETHVHEEKLEYYTFFQGEGFVVLDGVETPVQPGTIVLIRKGVWHTVKNVSAQPLLWAAFWWEN